MRSKRALRYGIALAALGMLATLSCGLTIDGFGPISDNAGGIAVPRWIQCNQNSYLTRDDDN